MRGLVVEEFPDGSRVVLPRVGLVGKGLVVEVMLSGGEVEGPVTSVLFSVTLDVGGKLVGPEVEVFPAGSRVVLLGLDVGRGLVVESFPSGPKVVLPRVVFPGVDVGRGLVVEVFTVGPRVVLPGMVDVGRGMVVAFKFSGGEVEGPVTSVLFSVVLVVAGMVVGPEVELFPFGSRVVLPGVGVVRGGLVVEVFPAGSRVGWMFEDYYPPY